MLTLGQRKLARVYRVRGWARRQRSLRVHTIVHVLFRNGKNKVNKLTFRLQTAQISIVSLTYAQMADKGPVGKSELIIVFKGAIKRLRGRAVNVQEPPEVSAGFISSSPPVPPSVVLLHVYILPSQQASPPLSTAGSLLKLVNFGFDVLIFPFSFSTRSSMTLYFYGYIQTD